MIPYSNSRTSEACWTGLNTQSPKVDETHPTEWLHLWYRHSFTLLIALYITAELLACLCLTYLHLNITLTSQAKVVHDH